MDPEDHDAIVRAVRDYVEGWYEGDVARMERCLHPDLVKRTVGRDAKTGMLRLRRRIDAARMVALTKEGGGSDVPPSQRTYETEVLDVFRHVATAKCVSPQYVDYLHLAKEGGRWLIVHALWELREGEMAAPPE